MNRMAAHTVRHTDHSYRTTMKQLWLNSQFFKRFQSNQRGHNLFGYLQSKTKIDKSWGTAMRINTFQTHTNLIYPQSNVSKFVNSTALLLKCQGSSDSINGSTGADLYYSKMTMSSTRCPGTDSSLIQAQGPFLKKSSGITAVQRYLALTELAWCSLATGSYLLSIQQ